MLGVETQIGALKSGMFADIIAVQSEPLVSTAALRLLNFVMKGGTTVRDGVLTQP